MAPAPSCPRRNSHVVASPVPSAGLAGASTCQLTLGLMSNPPSTSRLADAGAVQITEASGSVTVYEHGQN